MNKSNIPKKLRNLILESEQWGIEDDGYRCEKIVKSNTEELKQLVNIFTNDISEVFKEWLSDGKEVEKSTKEYLIFTCFFMAFEYVNVVLSERVLKKRLSY